MLLQRTSITVLLVALILLDSSSGLIFTVVPGDKKCFTEDLLENQRYELRYSMAKSLTPFVSVSVTGPQSSRLWSHPLAREEATEIIHSHAAGEYTVCFNTHKKAQTSASTLSVSFSVQDEREAAVIRNRLSAMKTQQMSKTMNSPAFVQAAYIEASVDAIHNDIRYLKQRESAMRDTNEDTNIRTWAFTLITVVVVGVTALLRHFKLKHFLIKKKILD